MLEERKEPGPDIPRRPEAIHLYGVDCMSNSDCLSYFGDHGPTFVEWIDDSSCNILFEDEFTAKRALIGRGKPLPPEDATPDTAGMTRYLHSCLPAHVIGVFEPAVAALSCKGLPSACAKCPESAQRASLLVPDARGLPPASAISATW